MKWPILKPPEKYSHASKFTKHFPSLNFEEYNIIKLQKWWYAIRSAVCRSLSTNKSCKTYKSTKEKKYDISQTVLPPYTHPNIDIEKEIYHAFSRDLWINLVKNIFVHQSTAPKAKVKLITYINNDNMSELLVSVSFAMSHQLARVWPKPPDCVI